MTESPTIHRPAPLALRLLARRRPPARAGGLRLARLVSDRRRVDRVLDATVRLSRGRTRTWSPPRIADAVVETSAWSVPEDSLAAEGGDLMSWWLDDDEPPLGHPDELAAMYMDPAERKAPRPATGLARRGVVQEVSGAGDERKPDRFRVSRSPEPPGPAAPTSPEAPAAVSEPEPVEPATPSAPTAPPESATPVPEPSAPVAAPVPPAARPTRPVVARAQSRPASTPARPAVVPRARVSAPAPAATPPATAAPTPAARGRTFPRLLGQLAAALRPRSRAPEAKPEVRPQPAARPEPAARAVRPDPVRATAPKAPGPVPDASLEVPQPVEDEPAAVVAPDEPHPVVEPAPLEPGEEALEVPPGPPVEVDAELPRPALRVSRAPLPDRESAEQSVGRQEPKAGGPPAPPESTPSGAPATPEAASATRVRDAGPPEPARAVAPPEPPRESASSDAAVPPELAPPEPDVEDLGSVVDAPRPAAPAAQSSDEPLAAEPAPRRPVVARRADPAPSRPLPRPSVARRRARPETPHVVPSAEPHGRLRRLLSRVGVSASAGGNLPSQPPARAEKRARGTRVAVGAHPAAAQEARSTETVPETSTQVASPAVSEASVPASRPLLRGVRRALGREPAPRREAQARPVSAPADTGAPAARPALTTASRPQIRVARRPAPGPTLARMPRTPSGSSAESLAAATGAAISHEPDGTAAITFHEEPARPQRPAPFAGPGPTIARATGPAAGPTLARASTPGSGGGDAYEDFVERLRRDLLREREQVGDLLGGTPW